MGSVFDSIELMAHGGEDFRAGGVKPCENCGEPSTGRTLDEVPICARCAADIGAAAGRITCPQCKGAGGWVWREADGSPDGKKCWTCDGFGQVPAERTLRAVTLTLCDLCLRGAGGHCNTPGCALCRSAAPDIPVRDATMHETQEKIR